MKNREFLSICYKFFNRFIVSFELIEKLNNLDKSLFSDTEKKEFDDLFYKINEIVKNIPNNEDDFIVNTKKKINELMSKIKKVSINTDDKELQKYLSEKLNNLKEDYKKEIDSQERWLAITNCINDNDFFNRCFDNLSDYELLEFIAQNISAPFPPQMTQEKFENLVKVGIENDEREWLWRLAFNYEGRNIKFDSIVNYFIEIKNGYYLIELISAVGECLDIDSIIDKISDKELIEDLMGRIDIIEPDLTEEQFSKLINKLNLCENNF